MKSAELLKEAAAALQTLQDENSSLKEEVFRLKKAQEVSFGLFKVGALSAERIQDKIRELSCMTDNELEVIKTASIISSKAKFNAFKINNSETQSEPFSTLSPEDTLLQALVDI